MLKNNTFISQLFYCILMLYFVLCQRRNTDLALHNFIGRILLFKALIRIFVTGLLGNIRRRNLCSPTVLRQPGKSVIFFRAIRQNIFKTAFPQRSSFAACRYGNGTKTGVSAMENYEFSRRYSSSNLNASNCRLSRTYPAHALLIKLFRKCSRRERQISTHVYRVQGGVA